MKKIILSPVILVLLTSMAGAAKVDISRNSVKSGKTKLKAGSEIAPGSSLNTGSKSRMQLSVGSRGGVYRTGSQTDAVLTSEQNLSLNKGIMLSSSGGGKGLSREALTVDTPEVRSTAKGTMLIAYQPGSYIKITCIEGRVTVKLKAALGEFVELRPGQMLILNPADKSLPEAVEVDLRELAASCALLGSDFPALTSESLFSSAAVRQERAVRGGDLEPTNMKLAGAGLVLSLERGIEGQRQAPPEPQQPEPPRDNGNHNDDDGGEPPAPPPPEPKDGYIIDETTVFEPSAAIIETPGFPTIKGESSIESGPTVYEFPDGLVNPALRIRNEVDIPRSAGGTTYSTIGTIQIGDGEVIGSDLISTSPQAAGSITTVVTTEDLLTLLAMHLRVEQSSAHADNGLYAEAQTVYVADSVLGSGNSVQLLADEEISILDSRIDAGSITLSSQGELYVSNSTLESHGSVYLNYNGADSTPLRISGSTVNAGDGNIILYSTGANPDTDAIQVDNSSLHASDSVIIGGSGFRGGVQLADSTAEALTGSVTVDTGGTGTADAGTITVDKSTLRAREGHVAVRNQSSNSSRTGILVRNSSQLLALASTGTVKLTTNGSQIQVSDSILTGGTSLSSSGTPGEILIDAMAGASPVDTLVQLNNVTASADVIRARSYNSGERDALVITGGRYDAASAIKFYAEGVSKLRFVGNVALNTPEAALAGKIVQVDAGGTVTGSGRVVVYADDHRYNTSPTSGGTQYGNIRANGGSGSPTPSKFEARPGF
ncbi:MAG: hypothetical protein JWM59_3578 [Verrucomicrobiales bacterium]|nr:hypothetical protein [Verrucomicrobiales bacterium]